MRAQGQDVLLKSLEAWQMKSIYDVDGAVSKVGKK
jgi:hypothetical protein